VTDVHTDSPPLTAEQQAVVEQPWNARVLVTAGAGAGKTHTLVRRLDALMSQGDDPLGADEILVLSFSRAAVRELKGRIHRHAREARRVRVQTFDAWAYGLLNSACPEEDWASQTFDERIRRADGAIVKGAVEAGEAGAPSHVVIDEVQDLVGDRRNMVETLLDHFQDSCGFTVVGDAAQAIYGFQIEDPDERAAETNAFFDWLRASYLDDLVELRLSDNFRASTAEARTALPLGEALQALPTARDKAQEAGETVYQELRAHLLAAPFLGNIAAPFTLASLRNSSDATALLCRDNRQALVLAQTLFENGVPHRLQSSVRDLSVPAWVARLLGRTGSAFLGEERFKELASEAGLPEGTDIDTVWRLLRAVARDRRGSVDVEKVCALVAQGRFPDELCAPVPVPLVVSTVHRAKGLEFDRVLVVEPPTLAELRKQHTTAPLDTASEARALYVAMTRPRHDLYRVDAPDVSRLRRDRAVGRWYVRGWKQYDRFGIEATPHDVCGDHPPGTDVFTTDPVALQDHLATGVGRGDAVVLRRAHDLQLGAEESPPYVVHHGQRPVAVVSERFRRDLYASLKVSRTWEIRWPDEIHGLRVETVESVAGSSASSARAGLGDHGVWLAPRLVGLGRYRTSESDKSESDKGEPS
jgi:hypothetical protein